MSEGYFGHLEVLPVEIRDIFMWLCQDVASLAHKLDTYRGLFGTPENLGLLHDTGRDAFRVIEESLRVDMAMLICRLSDPQFSFAPKGKKPKPGKKSKENLTFASLEEFFEDDDRLKSLIAEFNGACEPIRKHRDKLIANSDLNTRLKPDENLLPLVGRSEVEVIVERAGKILNRVAAVKADLEFRFEPKCALGVDTLLHYLRKGIEAERAEC
jgi:hypothetical protein